MSTQKQQNGFTIIEVVLVLAIAALIFLMVFIALPALQRGQANTARKSDMSTVAAAINSYRTNTNGSMPTLYSQMGSYVDKLSQADLPTTGNITAAATGSTITASATTLDTIRIFSSARCNGSVAKLGTARQAIVLTVVETAGGKYATVCQDA